MKKFSLLVFVLTLAVGSLQAQHKITRFGFEVRGDWQYDSSLGEPDRLNHSAFEGKFANFRMDGALSENLTYSFRYRLHKVQSNPFAATDWATLTYSTDRWELAGGKQVVAIGGYEYDRAPIDIYFASEYWHQIACYQFGVSAAYKLGDKVGSKLLGQLCQSPYDFAGQGLYAYNFMYMSNYSLSSLNLLEYAPGKFVGYVALGAKDSFGSVSVELDAMYRKDLAVERGDSFSLMADVAWRASDKFNVFTHASYDVNRSLVMHDPTVLPGTDMWHAGGGVEYFPMGTGDVRLHAAASYAFGDGLGALHDGDMMFQMGLTWRFNIIK